MTLTQSAAYSMSEFGKRIAVTLAALAIYRLGALVPVAGIDIEALADLYRMSGAIQPVERISIVALGITPIISILLLVELARLLSRRFNDWANAAPHNIRRLERWVLIGSLLLAAVQGLGIAKALESAGQLVADPGPQFRLGVMATLIASTALVVWLAALISRNGVGNGLWVLLLAPHLAGLPGVAMTLIDAMQAGMLSGASLVAACIYPVFAAAVIAALARRLARSGMPLDRALIWPLFIAAWLGGALLAVPLLIPAGPVQETAAALIDRDAPLYLIALAAIAIVISLAQWRRLLPHATTEAVEELPMALTALALAALAVVPQILITYFGVPALMDGRLIAAMVIVALPVQGLMQGRRG